MIAIQWVDMDFNSYIVGSGINHPIGLQRLMSWNSRSCANGNSLVARKDPSATNPWKNGSESPHHRVIISGYAIAICETIGWIYEKYHWVSFHWKSPTIVETVCQWHADNVILQDITRIVDHWTLIIPDCFGMAEADRLVGSSAVTYPVSGVKIDWSTFWVCSQF